jgi:hypothetical protein
MDKDKNSDFLKEIEMLDILDDDFKNKFDFSIWSTGSNSDYRNDRERPYNGQSWTSFGERGKTEVKGLTMRDIRDCLVKAMIISSPPTKDIDNIEFLKCWDFSKCDPNKDGDDAEPTQYLLENQDKFIHEKVRLGTWRTQDIYKLNWDDMDPMAICQNLTLEIEKMMGIFPNVLK